MKMSSCVFPGAVGVVGVDQRLAVLLVLVSGKNHLLILAILNELAGPDFLHPPSLPADLLAVEAPAALRIVLIRFGERHS